MRRGSSGPKAIAEIAAKVTQPLFRKRGFADGALVADWAAIVGERLAAVSLPESVQFPPKRRSQGTLKLRVAHGGLALELQHLQPQLIQQINGYFGYEAITHMQFIHAPLPPRKSHVTEEERPLDADEERELAALLADVEDGDLRRALDSLGRLVFGRRPRRKPWSDSAE